MPPFSHYLQRLSKYEEKLRKLQLQKPEKPCKIITTRHIIPKKDLFQTYETYLQYQINYHQEIKSVCIYMTDTNMNDPNAWTYVQRIAIEEIDAFLIETRIFNDQQKTNIRKWMERS